MIELHVLYVEDTDEQFLYYSDTLKRILQTEFGINILLSRAKAVEEALNVLRTSPLAFKIVIADMLFYVPGRPVPVTRGLDVLRAASRAGGSVVVALTQGDTVYNPDLERDAKQAGARVYRLHAQLNGDGNWERFCEEIYSALLEMGLIADQMKLKLEDSDPRLEHAVSEVGERNLKRLYEDLFSKAERPAEVTVSYVAPGLSGAIVLHCEGRRPGDIKQNHLFKANKNSNALMREVQNRPSGGYRGGLFIEYLPLTPNGLKPRGEWHAIGAVFERGAKTLREWLSVKRSGKVVRDMMHSLFLDDGLARGYSQDLDGNIRVTEALRLTLSRRARGLVSMKELGIIAAEVLGTNWTEVAGKVTVFIKKGNVGSLDHDEIQGMARVVRCHRDLHAANVLVRASRVPGVVIIDTAEVGNAHWATDYARLAVDLLMAAFQGPDAYKFDSLEEWMILCRSVIRRDLSIMPDLLGMGSVTALRWMVESYLDVFEFLRSRSDHSQWEWAYALAGEFVRAAYRLELTAPKRILGLMAASEAIGEVERAYVESRSR
jgi:hypothetical protein